MIRKSALWLTVGLLAGFAAPAMAGDSRDDAAVGSVLGGVLGAVVGNTMGGQSGAVIGAVVGATAGAYIAVEDDERRYRARHDSGRYFDSGRGYRDAHRNGYRNDRYDDHRSGRDPWRGYNWRGPAQQVRYDRRYDDDRSRYRSYRNGDHRDFDRRHDSRQEHRHWR